MITDTNYVMPVTIKQIYNTLLSARIHTNASQFIQPDVYEQRWQANRSQGVITLSGLLYNYSQFSDKAVTSGKLQVTNNQFMDKYIGSTWQNPYLTKQVFAIAPSVRSYKGFNLTIQFPSNLWLTNATQTVQTIQIDANDGLGYRTTGFGQNLAVAYTSAGLKSWKYKLTLNNGQVLYSHSKIIIEEGVVTTPHIDSSGANPLITQPSTNNNAATTETGLGRRNITATKSYNGSFGSAKLVIDYASADRKIRRPLIVAEGFDQGVLLNPEEEYGATTYLDFLNIIARSASFDLQSLLTNVDTKQYDIIYVDWNNGVDFIQKNAYVLEAVITWVNAEKLANGSTQTNVVLGASMGGLVARYALKDMEDFNLPTQTSLYVSFDAPHQGANVPIGYQYLSRHALHQYVQSPLLLMGGEVILPLFTDGVTPLDYLLLQDTPAARQMLISYVGLSYAISNTQHDNWQNELRLKGYPSMRKIAISNGNHCAIPQNAPAGANLLSIDGNYSTGWLTDIVLTVFPTVNAGIFGSIAALTNEPGFLVGILPGGNKITLDFKINSLPSSGTNQLYKGRITYTKKLLFLVNINVTITDKSINSPSNTLPYDYYPGGVFDTGVRSSNSSNSGNFWQQLLFKYKMTIVTEPSFNFVPAASALDIGLGNVSLNNADYLKKYNINAPLVAPKISPFNNYITSFQDFFILASEDGVNTISTNEHHIFLHFRNANWLAREIDNVANNNQAFDCSFICGDSQIIGPLVLCSSATYSVNVPAGTTVNWGISNTSAASITSQSGGNVTISATIGYRGDIILTSNISSDCGNVPLTKPIRVGQPDSPSSISGPSIVNTGAIVNYVAGSSNGATSYEWRLPYPFTIRTPLDYMSQDWQLEGPGNTGNARAVTGYTKKSGYVQVMGKNACGTGGAKLLYVQHATSGGGGGGIPRIDPNDDVVEVTIYPNPTQGKVTVALTNLEDYSGEPPTLIYGIQVLDQNFYERKFYNFNDQSRSQELNVSYLNTGLNYIIVYTDTGTFTKKLIVY